MREKGRNLGKLENLLRKLRNLRNGTMNSNTIFFNNNNMNCSVAYRPDKRRRLLKY